MHLVTAVHGTHGGGDHRCACIFERLARLQLRLLADNAFTLDLFDMPGRVGDNPVSRNQLRRFCTIICDGNVVGEDVPILIGLRLCQLAADAAGNPMLCLDDIMQFLHYAPFL